MSKLVENRKMKRYKGCKTIRGCRHEDAKLAKNKEDFARILQDFLRAAEVAALNDIAKDLGHLVWYGFVWGGGDGFRMR